MVFSECNISYFLPNIRQKYRILDKELRNLEKKATFAPLKIKKAAMVS